MDVCVGLDVDEDADEGVGVKCKCRCRWRCRGSRVAKRLYPGILDIMAKISIYIIRTFLVENLDNGQKKSISNSEVKVEIKAQD